jgi:hypothetical protein
VALPRPPTSFSELVHLSLFWPLSKLEIAEFAAIHAH